MSAVRFVSQSEVADFKQCRRRWALSWHMGVEPKRERIGKLALGTRVHEALEAHYNGGDAMATLLATAERERAEMSAPVANVVDADALAGVDWDSEARAALVLEHAKEVELAGIMVQGYLDWLEQTGADQGLEVIGTEVDLHVPLRLVSGTPQALWHVVLRGKLDSRFKLPDGTRVVKDYKTTDAFGRLTPTLHLAEQFFFYMLLERLSGARVEHVEGVMVDMLRKVKRTSSAKPPFYMREVVRHSDLELRNYFLQLLRCISDMLRLEGQLDELQDTRWQLPTLAYPSPSTDCSWRCPHFQACELMNRGERWEDFIAEQYSAKESRYDGAGAEERTKE